MDEFRAASLRGAANVIARIIRHHHQPTLAKRLIEDMKLTLPDMDAAQVEARDLDPIRDVLEGRPGA